MRCLEIKREMADEDLAAVTHLLNAAARADRRRPLSDHLYLDLFNGGLESGFAGLVAWEPGHEHPVAYAQVSKANESQIVELVVHPHHRYEMATIGPELLDAALDVVRAEGGGPVNWWVYEPTSAHQWMADAIHMVPGRTLYQMRRALPTERHATVETRAFVPGSDDEEWLAVNNAAFADHSEQGGWTLETFRQRRTEPWFQPEGFRVHERDGRIAAFCWTKVHEPDHEAEGTSPTDGHDGRLGEIYVIAVHPDFHGLGLGSELTLAGLDHLAAQGIRTGILYVDGDNEAAVRTYRRLGFEIHSTNAAFTTSVDARTGATPERIGDC
ncbi:MAG: mycothiol synthase [Actinomycetota bacterium]